MPYLIGGTITGTIMAYYYGFLFTIIVNSIIWFAISTLVNKFYWKYTGFKEEFQLAKKYVGRIKKKDEKHAEEANANNHLPSNDTGSRKIDN
ncbi:hypothetical protein [Candidatus Nitrosocosmicus hydrocola]|uniref:hypothetical protein n=1 Tax=Candidatus Nitrosocosmicus hydrocola TaxID=1826872 RepID=UPI0011E5EFD6|nr:hypothetical protein [Candidatus Nitrosocosmicus hydrocola]